MDVKEFTDDLQDSVDYWAETFLTERLNDYMIRVKIADKYYIVKVEEDKTWKK